MTTDDAIATMIKGLQTAIIASKDLVDKQALERSIVQVIRLIEETDTISKDDDVFMEVARLLSPETDMNHEIIAQVRGAASSSPFKGGPLGLDFYLMFLITLLHRWNSGEYFSCYHAVVNGSCTGKTRMLKQFIQEYSFGFFVNAGSNRPSESTTVITDWLQKRLSGADGVRLSYAFFTSCLKKLNSFVQTSISAGTVSTRKELFEKWFLLQTEDPTAFWGEITSEADRVELSWDRTRNYKNGFQASCTELRELLLSLPAPEMTDHSQLFSSLNVDTSVPDVNKRRKGNDTSAFNSPELFNSNHAAELYLSPPSNGQSDAVTLAWPDCLFIFDEAKGLIGKVFENLREGARFFPSEPANIVMVLADTTSSLSDFSPADRIQVTDLENPNGIIYKDFFSPFVNVLSFDVHLEHKVRTLSEIIPIEFYSTIGRAALAGFVLEVVGKCADKHTEEQRLNSVLAYLGDKIWGVHNDNLVTKRVAVLMFSIALNAEGDSKICRDLVASYMHYCCAVSIDRKIARIQPLPEPLLGYLSLKIIEENGWKFFIDVLCIPRLISEPNRGANGELAVQILLLMVFSVLRKKPHERFGAGRSFNHPIYPVFLLDMLKIMKVTEANLIGCNKPDSHDFQKYLFGLLQLSLKNYMCRVTQFIQSFAPRNAGYLKESFEAGMGIIAEMNTANFDGSIPVFVARDGATDFLDEQVTVDRMTEVTLQAKCNRAPAKAGIINAAASMARNSDLKNDDLFYVNLLMDCGRNKSGEPHVELFGMSEQVRTGRTQTKNPSDFGKCFGIYIRGLSPSHVLGKEYKTSTETIEEVDEAFTRLCLFERSPHKDDSLSGRIRIPVTLQTLMKNRE